MSNEKLNIVTEVGTFGSLNIDDPTAVEVKKKKKGEYTEEELQELINESIAENAKL